MDMQAAAITLHPEQPTPRTQAQAHVAGEVTLPGSLREATHILHASAMAVVEAAEAMQDRANVAGRVVFRVLYAQGEPARTDAIEASADFTHLCDVPGATPRAIMDARAEVTHVEASVSGGRMTMRAALALDVRAVNADPLDAVTDLTGDAVQRRTAEVKLRRRAASGAADTLLREEFALPPELSIRDTLGAQAVAVMQDATGGQGRIGLNGEVTLTAIHLSDVPGKPIVTTRHTIPVQQAMEVMGEAAPMLDGRITVKDVAVASQATDDGPVLRAEVLLGLQAWADAEETLTVLTDAYTTSGEDVRLTRAALPIRTGAEHLHAAESWKGALLLPEGSKPIRTAMAAFAAPHVTGWEQQGNRLLVTGTMDATLLYMPDDGAAPASAQAAIPFRASFAATAQGEDRLTLSAAEVEAAPITSDRAELRCILHLEVDGDRVEPVSLVTEVNAVPATAATGDIVLYYVQPGETLWDVARRYRVTEARLRELNPEAGESVRPGQGIVVWRQA